MKKLILIVALITAFWVVAAVAHEGGPNGVRHLEGRYDGMTGSQDCGSYQVWVKGDVNGRVTGCMGVFLDHEVIHYFPTKMTLRPDMNGKPEIGCSCWPVVTDQGGDS